MNGGPGKEEGKIRTKAKTYQTTTEESNDKSGQDMKQAKVETPCPPQVLQPSPQFVSLFWIIISEVFLYMSDLKALKLSKIPYL